MCMGEFQNGELKTPTIFMCLHEPEIEPQIHSYKESWVS